jgi:hypothetical protein
MRVHARDAGVELSLRGLLTGDDIRLGLDDIEEGDGGDDDDVSEYEVGPPGGHMGRYSRYDDAEPKYEQWSDEEFVGRE